MRTHLFSSLELFYGILILGGIWMFKPTEEFARELDQQDSLRGYKDEFYIKDNQIYMDGNSLGLLSKRSEQRLLEVLDSWKITGLMVGRKATILGFSFLKTLEAKWQL